MSASHNTRLFQWCVQHYVVTYFLMVVLFLAFGLMSLDLVKYVSANTRYLLEYGTEALLDGGLMQLAELIFKSFVAVLAYLGFKFCEHAIIQRASHHHN